MKYKLLKDLPGYKAGEIMGDEVSKNNVGYICSDYPDFFEPIVEKNIYDSLRSGDIIQFIEGNGDIGWDYHSKGKRCRSETFLTCEEAEDEHKRREWACRKDKFVPKENEMYYTYLDDGIDNCTISYGGNIMSSADILRINSGLAFRTREECEKAMKEHDLIRLFYTIR